MKDNIISVKAFAEKNNISQQAVYKKIRRNSDKLNGHISKQNGMMMKITDMFFSALLQFTQAFVWESFSVLSGRT